MKNSKRLILGLLITLIIYLIAVGLGKKINPDNSFFLSSFGTHTIMFVLSLIAIYSLKDHLNYNISFPKISKIIKPFFLAILLTIIINFITVNITKILGYKADIHPIFKGSSGLQILIFVFFYASIAEELLFRGFLLNFIKSYSNKNITIFKEKISYPILISGITFGLAHLVLLFSEVDVFFVVRVVIFASFLGILAGYYQEKYKNNAYAIVVHMGGNFMGVVAAFLMNLLH